MSTEYVITVDPKKCVACYGCFVACKEERGMPLGKQLLRVEKRWQGEGLQARCFYAPVMCMHCTEPACVPACPQKAISKDDTTGLVSIDEKKCIACEKCQVACPYHVPVIMDNKAHKCDLCAGRLDMDKDQPPCVLTCTTQAIHLTKLDEKAKKAACDALQSFCDQPTFG